MRRSIYMTWSGRTLSMYRLSVSWLQTLLNVLQTLHDLLLFERIKRQCRWHTSTLPLRFMSGVLRAVTWILKQNIFWPIILKNWGFSEHEQVLCMPHSMLDRHAWLFNISSVEFARNDCCASWIACATLNEFRLNCSLVSILAKRMGAQSVVKSVTWKLGVKVRCEMLLCWRFNECSRGVLECLRREIVLLYRSPSLVIGGSVLPNISGSAWGFHTMRYLLLLAFYGCYVYSVMWLLFVARAPV